MLHVFVRHAYSFVCRAPHNSFSPMKSGKLTIGKDWPACSQENFTCWRATGPCLPSKDVPHKFTTHISSKSQPFSLQLLQNGLCHIDCEALCLHQPARDWFGRRHIFIEYIAHTAHAHYRQWGRSAGTYRPYRQIYRPIIGTWDEKLQPQSCYWRGIYLKTRNLGRNQPQKKLNSKKFW